MQRDATVQKIWKEMVIDKLRCCPSICADGLKILVSQRRFKLSYPECKCRAFSLHRPIQHIEGMKMLSWWMLKPWFALSQVQIPSLLKIFVRFGYAMRAQSLKWLITESVLGSIKLLSMACWDFSLSGEDNCYLLRPVISGNDKYAIKVDSEGSDNV